MNMSPSLIELGTPLFEKMFEMCAIITDSPPPQTIVMVFARRFSCIPLFTLNSWSEQMLAGYCYKPVAYRTNTTLG